MSVSTRPSAAMGAVRQDIRHMRQSKLTRFIYRKAESLGLPYGATIYINSLAQERFSNGASIAACLGRATLELMELAEARRSA